MFKARVFPVRTGFVESVVEAGHDRSDLPQFTDREMHVDHSRSRDLARKLGFQKYNYENPRMDDFIDELDTHGIDIYKLQYTARQPRRYQEYSDFDGRPVFPELRNLFLWLLEYHLDGIRVLLAAGLVHLGENLFPVCCPGGTHAPSLPISLIGMAAVELCSPMAVAFLLDIGARHTDVHYPISFYGNYSPTNGCGSLIAADMRGSWRGSIENKLKILKLFMDCGDTTVIEAISVYHELPEFNDMHNGCLVVWANAQRRKSEQRRQRLETVVALTGIIACWRRVTNVPGSIAAQKAAKRFKANANC
jgi:hypothetical protein